MAFCDGGNLRDRKDSKSALRHSFSNAGRLFGIDVLIDGIRIDGSNTSSMRRSAAVRERERETKEEKW